jgi:hypothetical protein
MSQQETHVTSHIGSETAPVIHTVLVHLIVAGGWKDNICVMENFIFIFFARFELSLYSVLVNTWIAIESFKEAVLSFFASNIPI